MFENIRKIKLCGASFTTETTLDLFPQNDGRMSIIFGKNGSGKSTIAKAFGKIRGRLEPNILSASLLDSKDSIINLNEEEAKRVYIFDEDYIQKNIRLKEDGLNTIVILGPQGDLEDKIAQAQAKFNEIEDKKEKQLTIYKKYISEDSQLAPAHFLKEINQVLSGDNNWAGRERIICGLRRNSSVSSDTYLKIISSAPTSSPTDTLSRYSDMDKLLKQARQGNAEITERVQTNIPELIDVTLLEELLKQKLEIPTLSEREEHLLTLIQSGRLNEIQETFSSESITKCPFCYQPVSPEYKKGLIESIKVVLSREVENHKNSLKKLKMNLIDVNLNPFKKLDESFWKLAEDAVIELNNEITRCNNEIQRKIDDPFTPITILSVNLDKKRKIVIETLNNLENERIKYNKPFQNIDKLQKQLQVLNKQIAYYEILPLYQSYCKQTDDMKTEASKYDLLKEESASEKKLLDNLIYQKRNVNIAVDLINRNLRYVFFSKNRLEIKSSNGVYSLLSHGIHVKPSDISVGERNVIALCYFFTDMLTDLNIENGYCKDMFVVIDDPISSFDFENRIGIMSFLTAQIKQLMLDNGNSKLLVLTHDISALFDLDKSFNEINHIVKNIKNRSCTFNTFELSERVLRDFQKKKRHEYTELLKSVFLYAKDMTPDYELTIGNMMRRTLEAFSTFIYKKGIDTISCDSNILNQLGEPEYKSYFGNLMYRLVLNGESHMEERTKALIDPYFTVAVSSVEKQRTAQDIICFIYLLNPSHIKAHLANVDDFEVNIEKWCKRIRQFDSSQP